MSKTLKKFDGLWDNEDTLNENTTQDVKNHVISTSLNTLNVNELHHFKNHPFKLYKGQRLDEMVDSISRYGILTPIIVRKLEDCYEILSGHNRFEAGKQAGLIEVPVVLKEGLNDDEAMIIVIETNLMQRSFSDLLHSERAVVIVTMYNALKSQGVRRDLFTNIDVNSEETTQTASEKLAENYNLSESSIKRYLKLGQLNTYFLDLVDEEIIALNVGVQLAYLSKDTLEIIQSILESEKIKLDLKKADLLRTAEKEGKATEKEISKILRGEKKQKNAKGGEKTPKYLKPIFEKYFESSSEEEIKNILEVALKNYFNGEISSSDILNIEIDYDIGADMEE